ncbi:SH3 domain-containing protein [Marinobacter sp.]|uniref:SH3 domain-containing protein n=1 Tax=Marinobacter sp. TaxID=50741 RepID=UPI003A8D3938
MDYSNSGTSTTYQSGTVYGSGGDSATYSGTSTTYNNNTGQAFANLGKSIQRQNLFNDCMRGQGFTPQSEVSRRSSLNAALSPPAKTSYVRDIEEWEENQAAFGKADTALNETKLLSKPSFSGQLLDVAPVNTEVEILSVASGSWLRVNYNGKTGYIARSWAKNFRGEPAQFKQPDSFDNEDTQEAGAIVKAKNVPTAKVWHSTLSIFAKPDLNSRLLRGLIAGHRVVILDEPNEQWTKVQFGDVEGFVQSYGLRME